MCNTKNKINEITKLKQTHRYREQTDVARGEGVRGLGEKMKELSAKW